MRFTCWVLLIFLKWKASEGSVGELSGAVRIGAELQPLLLSPQKQHPRSPFQAK